MARLATEAEKDGRAQVKDDEEIQDLMRPDSYEQ